MPEPTATIFIYGEIGDNWWLEDPITGKSIAQQLKAIPMGSPIDLRINSLGGNVGEALAIYNLLKPRAKDITAYIDGYAVSAASFIPLVADNRISPESSIWMLHNPHTMTWGDADEHRHTASQLDTHRDALLAVYSERSGKSREEIITMLDAVTWLTGAEAVENGFATQTSSDALPVEQTMPQSFQKSFVNASTKKKLTQMGWKFAASGYGKKPTTIVNQEEKMTKIDEEVIMSKVDYVNGNDDRLARVEAQLAEADRERESFRASYEASMAQVEALEKREAINTKEKAINAKFNAYRNRAQGLTQSGRVSPAEFNALFEDDASQDAITKFTANLEQDPIAFYLEMREKFSEPVAFGSRLKDEPLMLDRKKEDKAEAAAKADSYMSRTHGKKFA